METKTSKLKSWWKKFRNFSLAILAIALILFVGIRYYYPYGEGVKTGQLNYVVYKGMIFKTYEGKLIQSGIWSNKPGGIQSNEFEFSIEDKIIAEELMRAGGKTVELHYKEYFGVIPWRGYSRYVVDKIVRIGNETPGDLSGIIPSEEE
ncbi:hypothetical protein [Massilibacteroides vaginae]|uniref:hypothetical protein n=1 Tax=Massilibacteroides vaginae TaxID=1673718 RepID=UPI000A1C9A37|nr:hypothetical protein [Massilibacteroides vaginae]